MSRESIGTTAIILLPLSFNGAALAQGVQQATEEVVVTATKNGYAEHVQDVPIAMTALSSSQLESMSFKNLTSLSHVSPNVQLDSNPSATAATANFSIRGLGVNSSIPSIDPTVGVFVDGVYMGIMAGVLFDTFDLEGIEILRGPQGVLFGRNVTGGAVLLRTRAPSQTFEVSGRAALESGPNYILDGSVSGPLVDGALSAKLAAYHNEDEGWFENRLDGASFGASRQTIVRPSLRWTPTEALDMTLRMEQGESAGDGPVGQNHALFSRDSFDFSIDERGRIESEWNQAFLETHYAIPWGDGSITNIVGWREYDSRSRLDVDATASAAFHGALAIDQRQRSAELRYAGMFGPAQLTTGVYYFQQDVLYVERRLLAAGRVDTTGGGDGDTSNYGVFASTDWLLTNSVTLNAGLRYSYEEKQVRVATIRAGGGNIAALTLVPDLVDSDSWSDVSPRVGLQWKPTEESQVYGYWAKGFRSGGYNFRNTDPGVTPGPFDSEEQSAFELGWKQDFGAGRARVNVAAFHNRIDSIQREVNTPGVLGVTQIIRNVGDATLRGMEIEGRLRMTHDLVLSMQAGFVHGEFESVTFDLNGDGRVDAADSAVKLPRLAPWTYGGSALYDQPLGAFGQLTFRVSFNHRDAAFFTDNNLGRLNAADMLDVNVSLAPASAPATFAIYATNLLDETTFGADTILPSSPAFGAGAGRPLPTFSPLNKGRVIGAEVRARF